MSGFLIVNGVEAWIETPIKIKCGIDLARYKKPKKRGTIKQHDNVVLHENAGSTDPVRVSNNFKKYGYHGAFTQDGTFIQYCDFSDLIYHGGQINGRALGLVFLNGYYPRLATNKNRIIPAQWWTHCKPKKDRRYSEPTDAQLRSAQDLIPKTCKLLGVPYVFPTAHLGPKQRKIKGWWRKAKPGAGVVAHGDYSGHSDGRFILENLINWEKETCPECGKEI